MAKMGTRSVRSVSRAAPSRSPGSPRKIAARTSLGAVISGALGEIVSMHAAASLGTDPSSCPRSSSARSCAISAGSPHKRKRKGLRRFA
jgi:hypothetical protein